METATVAGTDPSASATGLRRWTGEFVDRDVEQLFRESEFVSSASRLSTTAIAAGVLLSSFAVAEFVDLGASWRFLLLAVCRVVMVASVVAVVIVLRRAPALLAGRVGQACLFAGEALILGVALLSCALRPGDPTVHHLSALMLTIGIVLFAPGPVVAKSSLVAAFAGAYLVVASAAYPHLGISVGLLGANFAAAFVFGTVCLVQLERWRREAWSKLAQERAVTDRMRAALAHADVLQDELAHLARIDDLTALPNRRAFYDDARAMLAGSRHDGRPFSVLALDVDAFKTINDRFGHAAGDETLRALSAAMRSALREGELIGRVGGEEFAVAIAGSNESQATAIAGRIRQAIAATPLVVDGDQVVGVTVSVGVAEWRDDESFTELVQRSDVAMYASKRQGGDRVTAAAPADALTDTRSPG